MSFWKNTGPFIAKSNFIRSGVSEASKQGLMVAGEHVLGVANNQTPHEDGDLEASGAVSQDPQSGATAISYDTDYAVVQHEDESMQHDGGRNAKFLENALNSEREAVLDIVAQAIRGKLGT